MAASNKNAACAVMKAKRRAHQKYVQERPSSSSRRPEADNAGEVGLESANTEEIDVSNLPVETLKTHFHRRYSITARRRAKRRKSQDATSNTSYVQRQKTVTTRRDWTSAQTAQMTTCLRRVLVPPLSTSLTTRRRSVAVARRNFGIGKRSASLVWRAMIRNQRWCDWMMERACERVSKLASTSVGSVATEEWVAILRQRRPLTRF